MQHSSEEFYAGKLIINKLLSMNTKQMNGSCYCCYGCCRCFRCCCHSRCEQFSALCIKCNLNY